MAPGIEIFGRGATVVTTDETVRPRSTAPGWVALLLAVGTVAGLVAALVLDTAGDAAAGPVAIAATGAGALGAVLALVAILLGRGRRPALIALPVALLANPVLLTRLLDWASGFVG